MKFLLISRDTDVLDAAKEALHPSDVLVCEADWVKALDEAAGVDLIFIDLMATLDEAHKISGYEKFGGAKMSHAVAAEIPTVLISADPDYEIDYAVGWPGFLIGNIARPINYKQFRRAMTWV